MALEGNAKDFGLSEILQLIALQKKTGLLTITGDQTMVIYFRDGRVISTRDRRKMAYDPLQSYLLDYGFVSANEMSRLQQIQGETNLDLIDILVSEKKFSEDELRIIFAEQIQETIQDVLSWPKSQYKFMIGTQILQAVKSLGSLKVEGLLMESMRRIDEFPELKRIFTSVDTLVKRFPKPKDTELDDVEESVYELLEHPMRVGDVIPKARMARFCTYEALKTLLEKSLLQIIEAEKPAEVAAETPAVDESVPQRHGFLQAVAAAGVLLFCLAFGEIAVPYILPPGWGVARRGAVRATSETSAATVAPTLGELEFRRLEATIREALEEHLAQSGAYPASLDTLVSNGFLSRKTLGEAIGRGFTYHVANAGKSYSLVKSRP